MIIQNSINNIYTLIVAENISYYLALQTCKT